MFLSQDNSLVIESQKSVNVSSGDSEVSVSPDQVTINTQTFSVYTHDSTSPSPADQPPVLSVTNHSISVNADTLQVWALNICAQTTYSTISIYKVNNSCMVTLVFNTTYIHT